MATLMSSVKEIHISEIDQPLAWGFEHTGETQELAAILGDGESYTLNVNFISTGRSCCVSGRPLILPSLMDNEVPKLRLLPLVTVANSLLPRLLDRLCTILRVFLEDCRVDQLEVPVVPGDPGSGRVA